MAKATWNGAVLAESDRYEVVEGNVYFPPEALRREHVRESSTHTECGWKGTASYYDAIVDGKVNQDAVLVLPGPEACRGEHQGVLRVLEGREGGAVALVPQSASSPSAWSFTTRRSMGRSAR